MVAIESKDDLYVIDLLEDFDEFYLELEKFAEENRVPIIDKIGIRFLIQMLKVKKAKNFVLCSIKNSIDFGEIGGTVNQMGEIYKNIDVEKLY